MCLGSFLSWFLLFYFGPLCAYVFLYLVFCSLWCSPYFLEFSPDQGAACFALGFLCFTFCLCLYFHVFFSHGILMAFLGLVVFCFVPFLFFFLLYRFLGFPGPGVCLSSFWLFGVFCFVLVVLLFFSVFGPGCFVILMYCVFLFVSFP